MLRDDHSDYKWFFAFANPNAENAAQAIIGWCASFGVPKRPRSDGPTHFQNETLHLLAKGLKVPNHFTLPYTPWSSGTVERLGRKLLRVFQSVVSEIQLNMEEWPDLLPLVRILLNNAPAPQRGIVAPIKTFTSMEPITPISTFLRSMKATVVTIEEVQRERFLIVEHLQVQVTKLHALVQNSVRSNREQCRADTPRGQLPKFSAGEFVLVAREEFFAGKNRAIRWRGPSRFLKVLSDNVLQVEDIRNGIIQDIHGSRFKFYRDSSLDNEGIMSHVLYSETGMPVSRLHRLIEAPDLLNVVVRWKGLPDCQDSAEPLERVYEDVPRILLRLLPTQ